MLHRILPALALLLFPATAGSADAAVTGDALLNRYIAAVYQREADAAAASAEWHDAMIAALGIEHLRGDNDAVHEAMAGLSDEFYASIPDDRGGNPAILSVETVRGWEGEFGGDPRYWQVLSWCAQQQWMNARDGSGSPYDEPLARFEPLVEAVERGVADGPTLILLKELFRFTDPGFIDYQLKVQDDGAVQAQSDGYDYFGPRFTRSELEEQHADALGLQEWLGMDEAALFDAAVERSPEIAQVWYERALYRGLLDPDGAVADVVAGNAAPVSRVLLPFPLGEVFALAGGEHGQAHAPLIGMLDGATLEDDTERGMHMAQLSRLLLQRAGPSDAPRIADAMVGYHLREMLAEGATPQGLILATIGLQRLLREGVLEHGGLLLSTDDQAALEALLADVDSLYGRISEHQQQGVDSYTPADFDSGVTAAEHLAWSARYYGHAAADRLRDAEFLAGLRPEIRELEAVDVAALLMP
jgi:hypothetical protein